jgi:hypothetical protein
VVIVTHSYGNREGVRYLSSGVKVLSMQAVGDRAQSSNPHVCGVVYGVVCL